MTKIHDILLSLTHHHESKLNVFRYSPTSVLAQLDIKIASFMNYLFFPMSSNHFPVPSQPTRGRSEAHQWLRIAAVCYILYRQSISNAALRMSFSVCHWQGGCCRYRPLFLSSSCCDPSLFYGCSSELEELGRRTHSGLLLLLCLLFAIRNLWRITSATLS